MMTGEYREEVRHALSMRYCPFAHCDGRCPFQHADNDERMNDR